MTDRHARVAGRTSVVTSGVSGWQGCEPEHFLTAIREGCLSLSETSMSSQENVNARTPFGTTVLHVACVSGAADLVRMLIENRADVPDVRGDRSRIRHDDAATVNRENSLVVLKQWLTE